MTITRDEARQAIESYAIDHVDPLPDAADRLVAAVRAGNPGITVRATRDDVYPGEVVLRDATWLSGVLVAEQDVLDAILYRPESAGTIEG